jgi:fumarylacetoacetate (FAA) hydrolase
MAGTLIGSGAISNRDSAGGCGRPVDQGGLGYSCLAEMRAVETILEGNPRTPFMRFGDEVRIEMDDRSGQSVFGSIRQKVVQRNKAGSC